MEVAFRVDSSFILGTGHTKRCLTLALALRSKGVQCTFFSRELDGNVNRLISKEGFEVICQKGDDLRGLTGHPDENRPKREYMDSLAKLEIFRREWDWIVVDHYGLDEQWEVFAQGRCNRLAVIDDFGHRKHSCDLLVNPSIFNVRKETSERRSWITDCLCLSGPRYTLLRSEFDRAKDTLKLSKPDGDDRTINSVLVMFGGDDRLGNTFSAIEAVLESPLRDKPIHVIISRINRDRHNIISLCSGRKNIWVHDAPEETADLISECDLLIGSGGTTTWEALYLRKPTLLKIIAENQSGPLRDLEDLGQVNIYLDTKDLIKKLTHMASSGCNRPEALVENGTGLIALLMHQALTRVRKVKALDVRRSYRWMQDEELRRNFLSSSGCPTIRSHFVYWRSLMNNKHNMSFSILYKEVHVGHAGLKISEDDRNSAEAWLYIGESYVRGLGVGRQCLRCIEAEAKRVGIIRVWLHVSVSNEAAYGLYLKSGYTQSTSQASAEELLGSFPDVVRMEKRI